MQQGLDNYEVGKIDKGNYFNGTLRTSSKNIVIKRMSSLRQKKRKPAIYCWDCIYQETINGQSKSYRGEGHLLRGFTKNEIKKFIGESGLKFIGHFRNFEGKSFISVGQKKAAHAATIKKVRRAS